MKVVSVWPVQETCKTVQWLLNRAGYRPHGTVRDNGNLGFTSGVQGPAEYIKAL